MWARDTGLDVLFTFYSLCPKIIIVLDFLIISLTRFINKYILHFYFQVNVSKKTRFRDLFDDTNYIL
jgi:hypothetical protein